MRTRKTFLSYAEQLKSFGYRVFVNNEDKYSDISWGYYSNGKQVAEFIRGDYGGIRFGVAYHNEIEKDYRCVIDTWDEAVYELTKEIAEQKLLRYPFCDYLTPEENARMLPYENLDEWMKHHAMSRLHEI